ncbi:TRAP transporter fused permease subunit [Pseudolabrys sp. FHR47]|uniref:TRAP transporter permease n=1 Tax=Pseudolabrys sp. FHR47 TaxID=2562284 RepID=UPI0010BECD8E|nr:TRAP transporter fused permease subunit [Pseudolabrys sp. FHR47]
MSEVHAIDETADDKPAVSKVAAWATDILQALLLACVVGWVLDLPRKFLGLSLYTEQLLAICLGLALALSFINARFKHAVFGWIGAALALIICGYIAVRYEELTLSIALLPVEGIIGSAILVLLVLEATRRSAGAVLIVIILIISAYVFIGPHMPGDFATRAVSPERLLVYYGLDTNAIIGNILSVAVLIVVPFTLMGQVLGRTGGAAYFADLAMSGMGSFRGGAAKIAVVGSGLFGLISGAAVSNVMAVGIVTIPLMSRSGFSRTRAAAIEAVGSTGGQLMPPVMGAAAFLMAEFLQVPYGAVALAAFIPALLYYIALFVHVDLEAAKHKIGAAQVAEIPAFTAVLKSGWHFPIPLIFLIATLAWPEFFQIPIERAAVYSTAILIVLSLLFGYRGKRVSPGEMLRAVLDTGRAALDIILIGAAAGMVVGALNISGISFGLTLQLIAIAGENLFVLLALTAVISIILGMGMPTVSVYVLTASLLAPSIIKLGVSPMAAHMFVMYFGMLSMITPPVAIAAYAAANIARVPGWNAGWMAVVVGWSTFFIPFLFVTQPSLLFDGTWLEIGWNLSRNVLGIVIGTAAIVGFMFAPLAGPLRIAFGVAAIAILLPPNVFAGAQWIDIVGLTGALALMAFNWMQSRAQKQTAPQVAAP